MPVPIGVPRGGGWGRVQVGGGGGFPVENKGKGRLGGGEAGGKTTTCLQQRLCLVTLPHALSLALSLKLSVRSPSLSLSLCLSVCPSMRNSLALSLVSVCLSPVRPIRPHCVCMCVSWICLT